LMAPPELFPPSAPETRCTALYTCSNSGVRRPVQTGVKKGANRPMR
jgi:hypothetical protein